MTYARRWPLKMGVLLLGLWLAVRYHVFVDAHPVIIGAIAIPILGAIVADEYTSLRALWANVSKERNARPQ